MKIKIPNLGDSDLLKNGIVLGAAFTLGALGIKFALSEIDRITGGSYIPDDLYMSKLGMEYDDTDYESWANMYDGYGEQYNF